MISRNSTKAEVLEAVKQNGLALQYACYKLQTDRGFIVKAAKCMSDDSLYKIITDWIRHFHEN